MKFNKKKIVLLSSSLAGGGAEGVCVNIANGLSNRGWSVDLLVLNLKNEVYLNRLSKDVNFIKCIMVFNFPDRVFGSIHRLMDTLN